MRGRASFSFAHLCVAALASLRGSAIVQMQVPCDAYTSRARRGVACIRDSNERGVRLSAWGRLDLDLRTFPVPEHTTFCSNLGPLRI